MEALNTAGETGGIPWMFPLSTIHSDGNNGQSSQQTFHAYSFYAGFPGAASFPTQISGGIKGRDKEVIATLLPLGWLRSKLEDDIVKTNGLYFVAVSKHITPALVNTQVCDVYNR